MTTERIEFPGASRLTAAAAPELPQKDDLCGPFWVAAAARALDAIVVDQDEAAQLAGTRLWSGGDARPAGYAARRDYRIDLPDTDIADRAGTDRSGVARAVRRLTDRAVDVLEITDPSGRWSRDGLHVLVEAVAAVDGVVPVLANVATEHYRFPVDHDVPERYLATGDTSGYRVGDWRAGHFVAILGVRAGTGGRLYRIHDSYPLDPIASTGSPYIHDQPENAFCAALERPGRDPGALLIIGSDAALRPVARAVDRTGWAVHRIGDRDERVDGVAGPTQSVTTTSTRRDR